MNREPKNRKRLALDPETVRVLISDEAAHVVGGVGAGGGDQAAIKLSLTVSWGGDCHCCKGNVA